jgi:hypothetical protein
MMKKEYSVILLLFLFAAILQPGCSDPQSPSQKTPPTEYVWSADTLTNEFGDQITMRSIWGDSPDNIWLTGHSSYSKYEIYHFDGIEWKNIESFPPPELGAMAPRCVYGFSNGDVWFGGYQRAYDLDTAIIARYRDGNWANVPIMRRGKIGYSINNIWGRSPDDVWFAGVDDELYHWDGEKIKRIIVPIEHIFKPGTKNYSYVSGSTTTGKIYFSTTKYWNYNGEIIANYSMLLSYVPGGEWKIEIPGGAIITSIWMSSGDKLYAEASPLFYYNGSGGWTYVFEYGRGVHGPADNDLITFDDKVYYWDGKNGALIDTLTQPNVFYKCLWYDGKEAFVVGTIDNWKTIVFHGRAEN